MGFGPRFIGWVRTLYADVYSCVRVNGFLSGPVEQLGGVRQGCPLSPLLYVLFMKPFAELVRRDPGVDGVRLPGASGEVLKIQQYADDTTMFVSSARSLGRIRALTDLFGAGTGSKVNLAKSSVLYCGCWRDDRSGGGFSVCTGGLKILGVRFFARDSAALNWEARLNLVRTRLGVWTRRQLSLTGRVVVVRSVLLPLLIHLAYVFPVPARTKLALTRLVFRFLWGGRIFLERAPHGCYYFARFYLAGFFRHLVALSHVVPRSETPSPGYRSVLRFLRQCPSPVTREEATDHRALYARLASRQVVTPSGVPAGVVWSRVCGGGAPGAVRDLQWRCALGRLRGCGAPETVSHVFWDCPFAGEFWTLVRGLLRRVGPGHVLSRDGVVYRRGLGLLPSVTSGVLWDVLGPVPVAYPFPAIDRSPAYDDYMVYDQFTLPPPQPAIVPALDWIALPGDSGPFKFGLGRALPPHSDPAPDPPQEGARVESSTGGVEATAPPTTADLVTPLEWGDTKEPEGAAEAGWMTRPVKKRAISGEHEEARGPKQAPAIPIDPNPFQALAGSEGGADFCTGMDIELASPCTYPDWPLDGIIDCVSEIPTPPGAVPAPDTGPAEAIALPETGKGTGEPRAPLTTAPVPVPVRVEAGVAAAGEGVFLPSPEAVALPEELSTETMEWGNCCVPDPAWEQQRPRKRVLSGGEEGPGGRKSQNTSPPIATYNRFDVLSPEEWKREEERMDTEASSPMVATVDVEGLVAILEP
ncbi:hypothetical protein AAFF_G00190900 [Aldrovandia affinis]|uniref:Reverse transcriptase domain-containing protein n=1 Tax=Aldrovandia affinis TaxID=143900 RepID=A0AAD7VWM3_9TELE|nr:hypothetical protein AAFF_G00190900 [Aldrovandia affinis]